MRNLAVLALASSLVACGLFTAAPSPSPTATTAVTSAPPTATATATATVAPSPSPRPNPTAGPATYTNGGLGYRVDLPAGWRRSACQTTRGDAKVPYAETFTTGSVDEEFGSDIGPSTDVVTIRTEDAAGLTAAQWFANGRFGSGAGLRLDSTTLDGKDAGRIVMIATGAVVAYVVPGRGHMHILQRGQRVFDQSATAAATALINSFHVLTDAELAGPPFASATPGPARSSDEVGDALAKAFTQKDTAMLQTIASPCLTHAIENAGGTFAASSRVLKDLGTSFTNGLVVTVDPKTVLDQRADLVSIKGTWTDPGKAPKNVSFQIVRVGQTWYWDGWTDLQPR